MSAVVVLETARSQEPGLRRPHPAAWSSPMPFAGTATAASPPLPPSPRVRGRCRSAGSAVPRPSRPRPPEHLPVSATLAANEALAARRSRGQPVLPLAFGEAGLPAHPALRDALAAATASNGYGPVAGLDGAALGRRRVLAAARAADQPGLGRLRAGQQAAAVRPAAGGRRGRGGAQAQLGQLRRPGQPDRRPRALRARRARRGRHLRPGRARRRSVTAARAAGREIRSVVVTLPDNPTGGLPRPATVRAFCDGGRRA